MTADTHREQPPPGFWTGIEEFNRGEFFECHETLEMIWMEEPGPIRELYQGILQIGVAFYHLALGRYRPARVLLERGTNYVRSFAPAYFGVDVARLIADAGRCQAEMERLGPKRLDEFDWSLVPQIELETSEDE